MTCSPDKMKLLSLFAIVESNKGPSLQLGLRQWASLIFHQQIFIYETVLRLCQNMPWYWRGRMYPS
jgi:hypothetical protein